MLDAVSRTRGAITLSGAVQSLDAEVLGHVRRSNINATQLIEVALAASARGTNTYSEVILGLPGDSKAKHFASLDGLISAGFGRVNMFQLSLLPGSHLCTVEARSQFWMQTRWRVVPRCVGDYVVLSSRLATVEVDETCVALPDMSLANRLLVRRASAVALSSSASMELLPAGVRSRAVVTGNPIRVELLHGDPGRAVEALSWTAWDGSLPTVYVTGGAQGSAQVNRLLDSVLETVLQRANVVHQCGRSSLAEVLRRTEQLPAILAGRYRVLEFVGSELADVLALADVVVSRSGAGTLAELTALGKPSVLIPLVPTSGNEQEHNARYLQQAGAAHALLGDRPTPDDLRRALDGLICDAALRAEMAAAAARLGRPDAAHDLAAILLNLAGRRPEHPTAT